jgi:hypothetical protein
MFRNEIRSETVIEGTPDEVWAVLTDFDRYHEWNPGFSSASGRAEVGQTLHLTFAKEDGKGMKMHPTVLVADPGRELRWLGRLLMPGIFDGEHHFEIREIEPGRVQFVQDERFRGVLVPFLRKLIEVDTAGMFEKVNTALAARVRAQAGTQS